MGRRSKNKQAAPIPYAEPGENPSRSSHKKLGKRKAEVEMDEGIRESNRPSKKARDNDSRLGSKANGISKLKGSFKSAQKDGKAKPTKPKTAGSDESEGWEDVEDNIDLKAQAK